MSDDTWFDKAACKGRMEDFFPKKTADNPTGHKDITYIAAARKVCRSCPVREECLNYALEYPHTDMHGVWAGLTPRQLGSEQKRRGIKPIRPTIAKMHGEGK